MAAEGMQLPWRWTGIMISLSLWVIWKMSAYGKEHNLDYQGKSTEMGALFIATGRFYTERAVEAAKSVRETTPDLPIAIFTDQPIDNPIFAHVEHIEDPHSRSKVDYLLKSPFSRTLYLDSDIRARADLSHVFALLDRFDLAVAHVRFRDKPRRLISLKTDAPRAFPQMNMGVLLYGNSEKTRNLLSDWREEFHASGLDTDQSTFRECIWISSVNFYVLPPEYNTRTRFFGWKFWKHPKPIILHLKKYHSKFWSKPFPAYLGRRIGFL